MFTPTDYDFSADKTLSDYGLEASDLFPFETVAFHVNVLLLVASEFASGELMINTDAGINDVGLKLKAKNAAGNATSGGNVLISNEYIKTSTDGTGTVMIFVNYGDTFEFTGYSLITG